MCNRELLETRNQKSQRCQVSLPLRWWVILFFTSLEAARWRGGEGSNEVMTCNSILHTGLMTSYSAA